MKFEEYLREVHSLGYTGTDDNMPDSFDNWLSNLQVDELIVHADMWCGGNDVK